MGVPRRGFSLLEVLISFGLLSLVVFSSILVYTGLLAATSRADVNREAVAALDTVAHVAEERARQSWPNPPDFKPPLTYDRFTYAVEDHGRLPNPLKRDEPIQMKTLLVRVEFEEQAKDGTLVKRSYSTRALVAR